MKYEQTWFYDTMVRSFYPASSSYPEIMLCKCFEVQRAWAECVQLLTLHPRTGHEVDMCSPKTVAAEGVASESLAQQIMEYPESTLRANAEILLKK